MGELDGSTFERVLKEEILISERLRVRVLAGTLAVLLVVDQVAFWFYRDDVAQFINRPVPVLIPLFMFGPFLVYECLIAFVLYRRQSVRRNSVPTPARFANAVVETSLPTAILWALSTYTTPAVAFGTWPSLLYFIFIVAATLRLDFVLPAFTGAVAAIGYMTVVWAELPLSFASPEVVLSPVFHLTKAVVMLAAGIVAGLVAVRIRAKFMRAAEEAAARERVTNLFGQHVSPAVVEQLLDHPAEAAGEMREICVMFLDIANFTAQSRSRPPADVVEFLNRAFAFMIEAVDRHGGIVNKFLGDGFLAMFGAPIADHAAAAHAVAAARDILAEIDQGGLGDGPWPLKVRIGLHIGPAITGNVGSPRRKEFTAIGDTVNLASRLEQLNKEFGSRLLVSGTVVAALDGARGPATSLGAVAVRGYSEPVEVWRLD